ncbi:MAG: HAMP domain-containing histidine kinase [Muribaculaceae bacterium]|nr:HAMP domain-containing histidine kinase [Muribaculaceae bacterium]
MIWIIIIGIAVWQYKSETNYRRSQVEQQLALVVERIMKSYEEDYDPIPFIDFAVKYFRQNELYGNLRVTIFRDGRMIRAYGQPLGLADADRGIAIKDAIEMQASFDNDSYYVVNYRASDDGRLVVCTALPANTDVERATLPSDGFFWVMFIAAVVATIFAFFSTRYFSRNIQILRNVAERAASDRDFIPSQDYPHDELGDISRQIVTMYNERSNAMQRLKREHEVAMHAIEEKARAKRQLTNNINHELRTPIGVIKGYLDTILENPDMDEGSRNHFLKKAQDHVNRLVNLISDVSAITRLEEGGELISTEELDFHDVAFTIANDIEESGVLGTMEFHYDVPLDCKVMGNYNLLTGMLINLAKNAGAYSKGTKCELVCTGEDAKTYTFEFRDDGTGVKEEHLPHLFERFYRVDTGRSRKAGGTGLGLPIVQNTILAHGGTISVSNGSLGGLCFTFTLCKPAPGYRPVAV